MDAKTLVKSLFCFAIIVVFWFLPPADPITREGMRTIGVFIGTILLLSIVDSIWPVLLAFALLSMTGVMNLNAVLAGSMGNWITTFVLLSFIMAYALNEVGFTSRLTALYMSRKFVSKSPWVFTFAFMFLAGLVGLFIDQVAAAAFFLPFSNKIIKELGYEKGDLYPRILTLGTVFSINIWAAATPISHSLAMLGMGIYENALKKSISMINYMIFGIPVAAIIFVLLCVLMRLTFRPDFNKFKTFDIKNVLDKLGPMGVREKITVTIFFVTVFLWVFPGVIAIVAPQSPLLGFLNKFSITFWALIAVALLSFLQIDKKPILNLRHVLNKETVWNVIIFVSVGVFLGSIMSNDKVGLNAFVTEKLVPVTQNLPPITIILIIAFITTLMTNFASNVSTITVMTGVGVAMATSIGTINPMAVALTTTMCGSLAYMVPSSFAPIAMLHADEYSKSSTIIKYGFVCVLFSALIVTFVGYPIACLLG